jgi:glycosyltransferase involved in cell wall biosynthesis
MEPANGTIAFVVSGKSIIGAPGGYGTYSLSVARSLREAGYRVVVIGFAASDSESDFMGLEIVHVGTRLGKLASLGASRITTLFARRMCDFCNTHGAKSVLVFGAGVWSLAGIKLKQLLAPQGIKTITLAAYFTTYQHEYNGQLQGAPVAEYGLFAVAPVWLAGVFAKLFFRAGEHALLHSVDRIIIHWESSRQILLDEIPDLDPDKIVSLPFYVELYDRETAAPLTTNRTGDGVQLCAVNRQNPRKAMHVMLKALKLLVERGCPFNCEIIGSGPFLKANQRLAGKLGLGPHVQFRGFVASTREYLERSDIFVMSACEEGASSLSLLEAMLCGLAIASTDCDAIPEDIQHGENGLLSPVGDHRALADIIEQLIADEPLRQRLAARAKESYHEKYAFTAMKDGIQNLLGKL